MLDDVAPTARPAPAVRADCAPGGRFAAAWLALAEQHGVGPQVVLRSRLGDTDLLAARGVTSTMDVPTDPDADTAHTPISVAHPATMP